MKKYKEYDCIVLKDGRTGCIVDTEDGYSDCLVDIGSSEKDWDTITVKEDDILCLESEYEAYQSEHPEKQ